MLRLAPRQAFHRDRQLPPSARVPSITALMSEFGIACNTARRAVEVLKDEGLVTVRQGWGTFVVRHG